MAIPLEAENLRQFIRLNNRAIVMLQREFNGLSREYLWGARFVIKLLARQWAADVKARRHVGERD